MPFITNEQLKIAIKAIRQQDWADDYPKNADDMLEALLDQPDSNQLIDVPTVDGGVQLYKDLIVRILIKTGPVVMDEDDCNIDCSFRTLKTTLHDDGYRVYSVDHGV